MTELSMVISITVYKLSCLAIGALFCVLGYRLFRLGIWGAAGNVEAKFEDTSIVVKAAAPGTFFAILGAVIIGIALWNGVKYDLQSIVPSEAVVKEKPPLP